MIINFEFAYYLIYFLREIGYIIKFIFKNKRKIRKIFFNFIKTSQIFSFKSTNNYIKIKSLTIRLFLFRKKIKKSKI